MYKFFQKISRGLTRFFSITWSVKFREIIVPVSRNHPQFLQTFRAMLVISIRSERNRYAAEFKRVQFHISRPMPALFFPLLPSSHPLRRTHAASSPSAYLSLSVRLPVSRPSRFPDTDLSNFQITLPSARLRPTGGREALKLSVYPPYCVAGFLSSP